MNVTIVTPWLNHLELARDYWKAVRGAQVLVIDNASDPPLPNAIRLNYNAGFSKASNIGLEYARTDAVLFLNNDVVAFRDDWLERIQDAVEPGVLVGSRLRTDLHANVDGNRMPYLDGWCLAGMRQDLLDLGGFPEYLEEPAYFSDNLLCLEARAAGMTLREVPVGLRHKGGVTAMPDTNDEIRGVTLRNRDRYVKRARELFAMPLVGAV